MNNQVLMTIIEILVGIVVEGVLLSMVFTYISNISSEKQYRLLKDEMANIETQNQFELEQTLKSIESAKTEIISQIKEANYIKKGGNKNGF